jgi:hypothetical protein
VIVEVLAETQAIAGVSGKERVIEVTYPSIAATGLGRLIGSICSSIPVKIGGVPLSCLLFGLPVAPLGALIYLSQKVLGDRYILTNKSVEIRKSIGSNLVGRVELSNLNDITITVLSGQEFSRAGNLQLRDAKGSILATLPGVVWPERLKSAILEARQARVSNDAAFAQIQARK